MTVRIPTFVLPALLGVVLFTATDAPAADVSSDCPTVTTATGPAADPACVARINSALEACKSKKGQRVDCDQQCSYYTASKERVGQSQLAAEILKCFSSSSEIATTATTRSLKQILDDATQSRSTMLAAQSKVEKQIEAARKTKDVVKLNCLTDKLIQIRGHVGVAGKAIADLNTASAVNNIGEADHQSSRVQILVQKTHTLSVEADACVGDEASYVGTTRVDVEIDPNLPEEDPTTPPLPLPDVTRPPQASPFA